MVPGQMIANDMDSNHGRGYLGDNYNDGRCVIITLLSRKHKVFSQCWLNVGPASKTVGEH